MKKIFRFDPLTFFAAMIFTWLCVRFMAPAPPEEDFWPEIEQDSLSIEVDYAGISAPEAAAKGIKVHTKAKEVRGDAFYTAEGAPNYYAWTVYECKRREAQGRKGKEYYKYKDGKEWAIGYGCHIRYLSDEWKRTINKQGGKVNEDQARAIMVEVLDGLVKQVKADLPKLTRNQQLAIASISFNWGYGNVKRSGLWKRVRDGHLDHKEYDYWVNKTQSQTENHRRSRAFEASLFMAHKNDGHFISALTSAKAAHKDLQVRGDFKRY